MTGLPLLVIPITEALSAGVAFIVLVAFVAAAVYSVISLLKAGVKLSEPIVRVDRLASKGLRYLQYGTRL